MRWSSKRSVEREAKRLHASDSRRQGLRPVNNVNGAVGDVGIYGGKIVAAVDAGARSMATG
jgi:hypothetical protein